MKNPRIFLLTLLTLALSFSLMAQSIEEPDSNKRRELSTGSATSGKEINISCDGALSMFYGKKYAEFNENVQVRDQNGLLLTCEKLTVEFIDQNTIKRMEAEENVEIYHDTYTGRCQKADYTVATEIAIMTGNPAIQEGRNLYSADRITIHRKDGKVDFDPFARLKILPSENKSLDALEKADQ